MTRRPSRQLGLVHGRLTAALGVAGWLAVVTVFGVLWWRHAFIHVQQYEVLSVQGDVQLDGGPLAPAAAGVLAEGTRIVTGKDAVASLKLSEGSVIQLAPGTVVEVVEARTSGDGNTHKTVIRLDAGEIIRKLPPAGSDGVERRAELITPGVTIGVRGTVFAASLDGDRARTVVHHGKVALETGASASEDLGENYGTVVARGLPPEDPTVLLPPPAAAAPAPSGLVDAAGAPLSWSAVDGATGYVAEVALDERFDAVLGRVAASGTEAPFPVLPYDAPVHWRVASIDTRGLRGRGGEPRVAQYKVHHSRLRALAAAGDSAGALALAPAALQGYPDDPLLLADIGWAHYVGGDFARARSRYDAALVAAPDQTLILLRRARAEFWLEDYAAAEADYRKVIELAGDAEAADAWWGLGDLYRATGRVPEAVEALERALAAAPEHEYASLTLATVLAPTDPQRARALLDGHLARHPDDAAARALRARLD